MKVGIGYCDKKDAFSSGKEAAGRAIEQGKIDRPGVVLAFCHGRLNHSAFFKGVRSMIAGDVPIIGGSAIGVITNDYLSYDGHPAGVAVVQSDTLRLSIAAAECLDQDERRAGKRLGEELSKEREGKLLLTFYDSVRVPATVDTPPVLNASSPLIEGLSEGLQSSVPIMGAGLVGDFALGPPEQFCGFHVARQSVVGCIFSGEIVPYFRIMHGCSPLDGVYHRITKIAGPVIYELDGGPVVEMIDDVYGSQDWRHQHPVNMLTIGKNCGSRFEEPKESNYVNRLITGILPDGEGIVIFEPDFEEGTEIQFMLRDSVQMIESARRNSAELMEQIKADKRRAVFGIYIDCAGRAADYSNSTIEEASKVQEVFNQHNVPLFGFYSGVEIAPFLGRSRGLDWTGVLIAFAQG